MMRSEPNGENENAAKTGKRRCRHNRHAPVGAAKPGGQMRRGRSKRQRADEKADKQAAIADTPANRDLHADRIDAGHQRAGRNPDKDGDRAAERRNQQAGVERRRNDGRGNKNPARIETVGNAVDGDNQRADDEACLHAARQQGLPGCRNAALSGHVGQHGGRGEPQAHHRDLGQNKQRDGARFLRHRFSHGRFGRAKSLRRGG
jgi:hypothetical protein